MVGALRNPGFPDGAAPNQEWEGNIEAVNVGSSRENFRLRYDGLSKETPLDPDHWTYWILSGTGPAEFDIYLERETIDGWVTDDSHHIVILMLKGELRNPSFPDVVLPGEPWIGTIDVVNIGDVEGWGFRLEYGTKQTDSFFLNPGESRTVTIDDETGPVDFYIYLSRRVDPTTTERVTDDSYHLVIKAPTPVLPIPLWAIAAILGCVVVGGVVLAR